MDDLRPTSPLAGFSLAACGAPDTGDAGVRIRSRPGLGKIVVKARAGRRAIAEAVETATGLSLPDKGAIAHDGRHVAAVGPGEWVIIVPPGDRQRVLGDLVAAPGSTGAALIDVSSGSHALELRGPRAPALLSRGVAIDLSPRAFGPGAAARTKFDNVPLDLLRLDDGGLLLLVPRSHVWSFATTLVALSADDGVAFEESPA